MKTKLSAERKILLKLVKCFMMITFIGIVFLIEYTAILELIKYGNVSIRKCREIISVF